MAGAGTDGSDGGGLYTFTIVVSWTYVTSESGGDRLTSNQVIPVLKNVAMLCCLLGIDPARRTPGSHLTGTGELSYAFEFGVGETLGIELKYTDRPGFSMVGVTARPEEDASLYLDLSVRRLCGDISLESGAIRISRGVRVEAVVHLLRVGPVPARYVRHRQMCLQLDVSDKNDKKPPAIYVRQSYRCVQQILPKNFIVLSIHRLVLYFKSPIDRSLRITLFIKKTVACFAGII